ncbi:MAG: inositol monophosphatase family protein, partial [Gammaproteobacteria bacterium]
AGASTMRHLGRLDTLSIESKGRNDFVTEADRQAEQIIIDTIRGKYPDHGVNAEESGSSQDDSEFLWIIDPIDGTTNFLHGIPHFAISIALKYRGRLDQAVVYNPATEELFTASRGAGAQLNDKRIRVRGTRDLGSALCATGFPVRKPALRPRQDHMVKQVLDLTGDLRRAGTASLDLAYVAAGRIDAYWEFGLNEWDIAAGALLVQEAGGLTGDLAGGHDHLKSGDILAANPKLFANFLRSVKRTPPAND